MAAIQTQLQNILRIPAQKFSLVCPILDRLFDGGIPTSSITELVSESGCGKTQICLQILLLSAARSAAASLFIHTEFPFPFRQLSLSFPSPSGDPCNRIFIHAANSAEDLLALLDRSDELLAAPHQAYCHRLHRRPLPVGIGQQPERSETEVVALLQDRREAEGTGCQVLDRGGCHEPGGRFGGRGGAKWVEDWELRGSVYVRKEGLPCSGAGVGELREFEGVLVKE